MEQQRAQEFGASPSHEFNPSPLSEAEDALPDTGAGVRPRDTGCEPHCRHTPVTGGCSDPGSSPGHTGTAPQTRRRLPGPAACGPRLSGPAGPRCGATPLPAGPAHRTLPAGSARAGTDRSPRARSRPCRAPRRRALRHCSLAGPRPAHRQGQGPPFPRPGRRSTCAPPRRCRSRRARRAPP